MNRLSARIFKIVGQLLLAATLAACGPSDNTALSNTTDATVNRAQPPAEEPPPQELVHQRYALHEAASLNLIEYRVTGLGYSTGQSLQISVRRTTSTPLELYVEPGTVFAAGSADVQNMVGYSVAGAVEGPDPGTVQPTTNIYLDDDAFHSFRINAYCLNFRLENPSLQDAFQVRAVDGRAADILNAANSGGLNIAATQAAIWMDRDHATQQDIAETFDAATQQDLEDAWQLLMRLPPPT